jgi:UDPglucose--hexose-1-phosphate uridylyltransferase
VTYSRIDGKLFDGRDLFYFDDSQTNLPATRKPDSRQSAERPQTAELRFDPLTSEWITVASHRQQRAFLPPQHSCPLCPTTENNLSELPDNFDVAVFENKGPAFGPELGQIENPNGKPRFGFSTTSFGRCEVVVFSPEHQGSLSQMPVSRVRTVIGALMDRTRELFSLEGVVQVFPFENRGEEIGVTLHHPHGQIYSYPFVPPRTKALLDSVAAHKGDFFEDLIAFETGSKRKLLESEHFVAFVPYAARWPLEIHLLPKRHIQDLSQLTDQEADDLAVQYRNLLMAVDALYGSPTPYISAWHQAPKVINREQIRLMLQITSPRRAADKLKYLAGSESAMGAFVGDVEPEQTAARIREVM